MPFQLRDYTPTDFDTLYEIDRDCYPRGIAYSRSTLRWFLSQRGADCLVAESSAAEAPRGATIGGFLITESEGEAAHIITLDVVAAHRRGGVGSALLSAAEGRLAARGVRRVSLETATDNEAGVAFWQRHGYRTCGVMRRYYLGRTDAFAMIKTLPTIKERHRA
jgi:ribosomal-protein-alanine N-acetyltransferase